MSSGGRPSAALTPRCAPPSGAACRASPSGGWATRRGASPPSWVPCRRSAPRPSGFPSQNRPRRAESAGGRRCPLARDGRGTLGVMDDSAGVEPRFLRDNLLLNAGALTAGVANVLYHVVVARMLGPVSYGVLTALGTVVLLLEVPVSVLALVYTRRGSHPRRLRSLNVRLLMGGAGVWIVLAVWRRPVAGLFHLPPGLVMLFGLAVVPAYAYGLNVGVLQWAGRFGWAGAAIAWDAVGATVGAFLEYVGRLG